MRGVELPVPAGWQRSADTDDPDVICLLTQGDAELIIYLEDSGGRSLAGLWTALRYAVVVDWGGTLLGDRGCKLAGVPARELEFAATPEGESPRRYLRALAVRGDHKLTVQASAPAGAFGPVRAALQALVGTLRWREASSPEQV